MSATISTKDSFIEVMNKEDWNKRAKKDGDVIITDLAIFRIGNDFDGYFSTELTRAKVETLIEVLKGLLK